MTNINSGLKIYEPEGGIKFGTDALLLAHFMLPYAGRRGFELGTGSGVISLLYLSQNRSSHITAAEIQPVYASAAEVNADANGFSDRLLVVNEDIRLCREKYENGSFDFVFTNPPYFGRNSGRTSANERRRKAFHEGESGIDDFLDSAAWLLKNGGRFYAVYRPERMAVLMHGMMTRGITAKRLRLVFSDSTKSPSLMLIEGRKGGADGMITMPNLYIYQDLSHSAYSDGMQEIYNTFKLI